MGRYNPTCSHSRARSRADIRRLFGIVGVPSLLSRFSLDAREREALEDIVALEWEQFGEVEGMDGRASCQDDVQGFFVYRVSQYLAFPHEILPSLRDFLLREAAAGRNLVREKYARMMARTDPEAYERVWKGCLEEPSPVKAQRLSEVAELLRDFGRAAAEAAPMAHRRARPDESSQGAVSSLDYYLAEVTCYPLSTLRLLRDGLARLRREGRNPVLDSYANSVSILRTLEVCSHGKTDAR